MPLRPPAGFIRPGYDPLKNPNAPTIGTATGVSSTSVSVTFTAPANTGGGAISSYLVYSIPGNFNVTGASSPLVVTGLTLGTAYTFKVVANNSYGPSSSSASSNSASPVLQPGEAYGGGYFAGQISTTANGVPTHNLVVCDITVGQAYGLTWGTYNNSTGIQSVIDGPANSASLAALGAGFQAATFCEGITTGGYTDWYMPAQNELEVMYFSLKPNTTSNSTSYGSNANAVSPEPISTNYSSGIPTRTAATNFRSGASSQEFSPNYYWASNELTGFYASYYAWIQNFNNGAGLQSTENSKNYTSNYVRACRRVAI